MIDPSKPTAEQIMAAGLIMARFCANGIGHVEAAPEHERGDVAIAFLKQARAAAERLGFCPSTGATGKDPLRRRIG